MNRKEQTYKRIVRNRIIAVVREKRPEYVEPLIDVLSRSGITTIEITLTTPDALELISLHAKRPDLLIGAASVLGRNQADRVFSAGAHFFASPCTNSTIIEAAHEAECVAISRGLTPQELYTAYQAGADLVKIFPLPPNGSAYLRSILGPMPEIRLAPSGGITDSNGKELLDSGAVALNVGSWLTPKHESLQTRIEETERRAGLLLKAIDR